MSALFNQSFFTKTETSIDPKSFIDTIRQSFYGCRFKDVMQKIDSVNLLSLNERSYVEIQLLKAQTFYEQSKTPESKEVLKQFRVFRKIECKASFNYAAGKLAYFDDDFILAEKYFSEIKFLTDDSVLQFRSYLGLCNIYLSLNTPKKLTPIFVELSRLLPYVNDEEKISYNILLGNFYRDVNSDGILAKRYFSLALSLAESRGWSYFSQRCIYGFACIAKRRGDSEGLAYLLEILYASLQNSESEFLKFLIREKFHKTAALSEEPYEIDRNRLRIRFGNQWIAFHDRLLMFKFIQLLDIKKDFVSKAQLASSLWSEQKYLPRTHDPHIFDIAKRVRFELANLGECPIDILSSRKGYKIIRTKSTDDQHRGSL